MGRRSGVCDRSCFEPQPPLASRPASADTFSIATVADSCLEELRRRLRVVVQLRWQSRHAQLSAIAVQQLQHEEVAAAEGVKPGAFALLTQHARNLNRPVDLGHVAVLAALLVAVIAVQPLRIGHLFGQFANRLFRPAPRAVVMSVWHVPHSSDSRMCSAFSGR